MKNSVLRAAAGALRSFSMICAIALASTSVLAADLNTNAERSSDANEVLGSKFHPFSACNLSIGASVGYGRLATSEHVTGVGTGTGSASLPLAADGAIANLGTGCDMHFGRTVVGGFGTYGFGNVGTRVGDVSIDINGQWAVGGRVGYMVRPEWLLYTSLALAHGNADIKWTNSEAARSLQGVRFGLGSEYKLAAPVWLRLEGTGTRYEGIEVGGVDVHPTIYKATAEVVFKF